MKASLMTEWSQSMSDDQLTQLDRNVRLLLIHPHYRQQKHLLHHILQSDKTGYVRFEGNDLVYSDIESQVQFVLQLADKNEYETLVLDECDRTNQDEFDEFVTTFLEQFSTTRLIIVSRTVPYTIVQNSDLRSKSRFLPTNESLMLFDYAARSDERVLLEVHAFGSGHVYVNGKAINEWDGILPRLLFFYLIDRGMVTRNDIFNTFWPDMTIKEATNVFHVTKRKISEILGVNLTKYWSGFYRISPQIELSYDVIRFSDLIQNSVISAPEQSINLLEQAIALYRSPLLNSFESGAPVWIEGRRSELRDMYGESLSMLADLKNSIGDVQKALGLYLLAVKITPLREDLIESAMKIYRTNGQLDDALNLYRWLSNSLDEQLKIAPSESLKELAQAIENELG